MQAAFADALTALNLVTSGVLVGIVVAELVVILPVIRQLEPANAVAALRFAGFRAWRLAPYFGAAAGFSGLGVIAIWPSESSSTAGLLTIAGLALWIVAAVVTFAWYFPVDARIRGLSPNAAPVEAPSLFHRLAQLHLLRTTFYFAGFVCFALGGVLR